MKMQVEADMVAGHWVPIYHGNGYKVARLAHDRRRTQEESAEKWPTLEDAEREARNRNQKGRR